MERDTTGTVRDATGAVAERMGRAAAEASVSGAAGSADSAEALTNALRLCGYQPSLQDAGDITLRNCPFDRAAKTHRDTVCLLNLRLVQGLVDGVGGDAARAALEPAPGHCCVVIHPGADRRAPRPRASTPSGAHLSVRSRRGSGSHLGSNMQGWYPQGNCRMMTQGGTNNVQTPEQWG